MYEVLNCHLYVKGKCLCRSSLYRVSVHKFFFAHFFPPPKLYILHTNVIPYFYHIFLKALKIQNRFFFFNEFTLKTESGLVSLLLCSLKWTALAQGFIKWLLKQSRCLSVYWLLQTLGFCFFYRPNKGLALNVCS